MTRKEEIKIAAVSYVRLSNRICPDEKSFFDGAEWADNHLKSPWISVKEKLPPEEECGLSVRVLVLNTDKKTGFGRYDYDNKTWLGPGLDMEFTHWMLIPEPPKTGD